MTELENRIIVELSKKVIDNIAKKYKKITKGVDKVMGGKVIETEAKKMYNRGIKIGEENGRIDGRKAFFGNLLNIKPVMQMSKTGTLEVLYKVISRKKSISSLASLTEKMYDDDYSYCFISHANCLNDALLLKEKIEKTTNLKPIITHLGPVIGCHSGPGTLAIYFIGKQDI